MKKLLLAFVLVNCTSGCVWYHDHFGHDNGLHRGHHKDHHDGHHNGHRGDNDDQGNKHHGKKGKHHKDHD